MKSTQFPDWPAGLGKIATKYVNSCYLVSSCVLTVLSLSASKPYLVIFQTKNELPSGSDMMPGQAREFLNSETKTTGLRNEADCQVMERKKCPVLDSAEARKNTDNSPSLLRKNQRNGAGVRTGRKQKPQLVAETCMWATYWGDSYKGFTNPRAEQPVLMCSPTSATDCFQNCRNSHQWLVI